MKQKINKTHSLKIKCEKLLEELEADRRERDLAYFEEIKQRNREDAEEYHRRDRKKEANWYENRYNGCLD